MWIMWRYYKAWWAGLPLLIVGLITIPAVGVGSPFFAGLLLVVLTAVLRGWAFAFPGGRWGLYVQRQKLTSRS